MKKDLFDTKEKIDQAVANFKQLLDHPGWKLFEDIVSANIEVLKDQILNGLENETKETIDRLRDKLKVLEEMRNTPKSMIEKLTSEEGEIPKVDPYLTVEELRQRKEKQTA